MKRLLILLLILLFFGCAGLMPKNTGYPQIEQPGETFRIEELTQRGAANKIRAFTEIEGGGAGALDAILCANLVENDLAIAYDVNSSTLYFYWFDDGDETAEASPFFIRPDDYANCGNGVWKLMTSWGTAGTATPTVTFRDSNQAMDDVAVLYANANDADDSYFYLQVEVGGAPVTFMILDGVNERVQLNYPLVTTSDIMGGINVSSKAGAYTVGTDDAYEAYGTLFVNTNVIDLTLPATEVIGMNGCIVQGAGVAGIMTLQPAAGAHLVYQGVEMNDGTDLASAGAATDRICWVCISSDHYIITSSVGVWAE